MKFEIRDFIESDREFFLENESVFYDSDAVTQPVSVSFFERTFDECLKGSPYIQGMMITVDGESAGFALLSFTYSNEVGGLVILIEELYIKPKYQGHGIGSEIFRMIEERYVTSGKARRLRLEVTKENKGALELYKKLGFTSIEYIQMIKDFI